MIFIGFLFSGSAFSSDYNVTAQTAPTGKNSTVSLNNETNFNLVGETLIVGDYLPSVALTRHDFTNYETSKEKDRVRIFSVLASVDTPVCHQQANELSKTVETYGDLLQDIDFIALSADTVFAQKRFIADNKLSSKVTFLSDSLYHDFGIKSGTQIRELGLMARTIIVVDKNNRIVYLQRVPELTTLPDLSKAIEIAKANI
nr:redoxin family protein [Vibrio anguillarum]